MDALSGDEEARSLLILDALPGVGPAGVARAVRSFGSARAAVRAPATRLAAVLARAPVRRGDVDAAARAVDRGLTTAHRLGLRLLTWTHPAYPGTLRHLADPPPVLFLRGGAAVPPAGVGVVGARRCTARGRDVARRLGSALGVCRRAVISGLALGIDGAAHRGALDAGGTTVAVLGCGPDRAYPPSHARLMDRILAEGGVVVSEFLPGTPPLPHHFPRRNRVLAALCSALVVVEAGARSGALITVDHALDLGVDVWAVPGPIDVAATAGSNRILADGARPLVDVEAFVRAVAPGAPAAAAPGPGRSPGARKDAAADRILEALRDGAMAVDSLARRVGIDPPRTAALLGRLEVEGRVERLPGARVRRAG